MQFNVRCEIKSTNSAYLLFLCKFTSSHNYYINSALYFLSTTIHYLDLVNIDQVRPYLGKYRPL